MLAAIKKPNGACGRNDPEYRLNRITDAYSATARGSAGHGRSAVLVRRTAAASPARSLPDKLEQQTAQAFEAASKKPLLVEKPKGKEAKHGRRKCNNCRYAIGQHRPTILAPAAPRVRCGTPARKHHDRGETIRSSRQMWEPDPGPSGDRNRTQAAPTSMIARSAHREVQRAITACLRAEHLYNLISSPIDFAAAR